MDDIKFKREHDTTIWVQDIDSDIQKTTSGIWTNDNPFIDVGRQKIKFDCKSWLELKKEVSQLIKQTIEIGDIVDTPYGKGMVKNIFGYMYFTPRRYIILNENGNYILCSEDSVKVVCKKENKNDKGENVNMENKELDRIRELALNIINKVRNYKLELAKSDYDKKREEITKDAKINELFEKHSKNLKNEISELLKRECNNSIKAYVIPIFGNWDVKFKVDDNFLTENERSSVKELLTEYENKQDQIRKQFDNIIDSLELCTTVDQINEFLDNQRFRVNGLIVNPEDWKG